MLHNEGVEKIRWNVRVDLIVAVENEQNFSFERTILRTLRLYVTCYLQKYFQKCYKITMTHQYLLVCCRG